MENRAVFILGTPDGLTVVPACRSGAFFRQLGRGVHHQRVWHGPLLPQFAGRGSGLAAHVHHAAGWVPAGQKADGG